MSIIEQALRKLELSQWNEQQVASEYLKPTQVIATGGRHFPGPIWLAAGGLVVAAVVIFVNWPYLSSSRYFVSSMPGKNDKLTGSVELPLPKPASAPAANATVPGQGQGQVAASTQKSPGVVLDWNAATWIRDGAAAMVKNDVVGAVRVWSSGLEQLPGNYPLVILPPSASRASALALYNSLVGRYPVVLVETGPPGEQQLGVMVVPERKEVAELMTDLRSTLKRNSLATTTVMAWRTTQAGNKDKSLPLAAAPGTVSAALAAASNGAALVVANAGKPKDNDKDKDKDKVGSPAAAMTSEENLDPTRSVQGSAVSSAEAILRRFTGVERLIAKGQFEAALDAVVLVESDVGETWQTRYLKGTAAKGLARWDEAILALTRANQLNPLSVKVLLDRAICLQELGNHAAALEDLHLASALNPHMPQVVLNTGYSLDAMGRRAEALREYKLYLDMTADRNEYAKVRAWVVKRVAR